MDNFIGIVITCVADSDDEVRYYANDQQSGGYPCWISNLQNAKFFKSFTDAEAVLKSNDFNKENKYTDGTIHPPSMIHRGAKINDKLPSSGMTVNIKSIQLINIHEERFTGSIKKPKGYIY